MPTVRRSIAAAFLVISLGGLAACGHSPDGRTVQQAVDDTVSGD